MIIMTTRTPSFLLKIRIMTMMTTNYRSDDDDDDYDDYLVVLVSSIIYSFVSLMFVLPRLHGEQMLGRCSA